MKTVLSDDDVIDCLRGENSLLDGQIKKIEIDGENDGVKIYVHIHMRRNSDYESAVVEFIDCEEYCFSFSSDFYFYCIESLKFFKTDGGMFYVSFDPFDAGDQICNEDKDVILSRSIAARVTQRSRV
ncbi:MAG: hypothetical protein NVV73_17190 [Cellvibrionaceae bacterium]|nr:hypothetical protein [Cellvibrionaceae bacterium]